MSVSEPNPSIERTSNSRLRRLLAAAHVKTLGEGMRTSANTSAKTIAAILFLLFGSVICFFGLAFVVGGASIAITGDELGHAGGLVIFLTGTGSCIAGAVLVQRGRKKLNEPEHRGEFRDA